MGFRCGLLWGIASPHEEHFALTGMLFSSYLICNNGVSDILRVYQQD